jgi:hypothetical protein
MAEEAVTNITLEYPITVQQDDGSKLVIDTLKIGRLKAKHLKHLPESMLNGKKGQKAKLKVHEIIPMVAGLTGYSETIIEEVDLDDLFKIADAISELMGE